jgi:hypothetical protein
MLKQIIESLHIASTWHSKERLSFMYFIILSAYQTKNFEPIIAKSQEDPGMMKSTKIKPMRMANVPTKI